VSRQRRGQRVSRGSAIAGRPLNTTGVGDNRDNERGAAIDSSGHPPPLRQSVGTLPPAAASHACACVFGAAHGHVYQGKSWPRCRRLLRGLQFEEAQQATGDVGNVTACLIIASGAVFERTA
jgi:hypothetical protein